MAQKLQDQDYALSVTQEQKREIHKACVDNRIEICPSFMRVDGTMVYYGSSGRYVFSLNPSGRYLDRPREISPTEFIDRCKNGIES